LGVSAFAPAFRLMDLAARTADGCNGLPRRSEGRTPAYETDL
jgi:hypothetical protein